MGDHVADLPQYPKREVAGSVVKADMDAQRFAHISDLTYSAQQVSSSPQAMFMCALQSSFLHQWLSKKPYVSMRA